MFAVRPNHGSTIKGHIQKAFSTPEFLLMAKSLKPNCLTHPLHFVSSAAQSALATVPLSVL